MKIRSLKLTSSNLLLGKIKVFVIALFCLSMTTLNGQSYQYMGNGTYQFQSLYPEGDLLFWLFDDGYHSFSPSPVHQFGEYALPCIPKLYHAEPYDIILDDFSIGVIENGGSSNGFSNPDFNNQIELKRSWNLVNSKENFYILMFENSQYSESISGCVEFHFNENNTLISAENILDNYNNNWVEAEVLETSEYEGYTHKYTWTFYDLDPDEQRFIYIPAFCDATTMSSVFTRGVLKVIECETVIEEDFQKDGSNSGIFNSPMYTLRSVVSNYPHDPNFISSDPNCWTTELSQTQTIRYRLHFQNKGDDFSKDVLVNFLSKAPFESVELINSSDNCSLYWDNNDINVNFNSIYIRGLNEFPAPNYESTIGWIEIDVCYNVESIENLYIDCIEFVAEVLFDGQHPVIANNLICNEQHCQSEDSNDDNTGICIPAQQYQGINHGEIGNKISTNLEIKSELGFDIHPNPTNQFISIKCKNLDKISRVFITNTLGEVKLSNQSFRYSNNTIDISSLTAGLYFINVIIYGKKYSKSIIKT